jgi:predicted SprT family Zn-dependent metalloprotease
MKSPTLRTYNEITKAYDFFNKKLFHGTLPPCLITMQRQNRTYGYFAGECFGSRDGREITDEIALNPTHFRERTTEESLSTLVHEMAHLWQHHHGTRPRKGYHSREWAAKMREVGLVPTDTGVEGGKETGQHVSHYIANDGRFAKACNALVGSGFALPYIERWNDEDDQKRKKKAASKTRYTCPSCGVNAWGKPTINLICGECEKKMEAEELFAATLRLP